MNEELIKRLRTRAKQYMSAQLYDQASMLMEAADALSRPAPAVQVPEGVLQKIQDFVWAKRPLFDTIHRWNRSDMDAAIAEALSFYLAAAPAPATVATEAVAQECFTHAAGQVVPKAMYDQLMSNYIALSGKAVDAEKIMAPITLLRRCLERMESDWLQIESEWGPTDGGLDADIANGNADEIRDLRALLAAPAGMPSV